MNSETTAMTAFNSSFTSLPEGEYEVFLSFRGPDTRHTFTDFLYTSLEGVGVCTFRDDNELRKGEEIGPELLKAITQSKISIPIFSKNYASSKWCLRELAKMMECRRTTRQVILPIFYDVEPSFHEYESFLNESTPKEWKEALREVGAIKGWNLKKEADGHHGKLIKMVVQTVLLLLKKNCIVLTDNLVGIKDHVNEMMRLLEVDSNDIRIVGIYGMGGIGKTTIAKCIYNELVSCFECCSFLADIRETAKEEKDLVSLQKQFLADSNFKSCLDIANVSSGINIIKERFRKKKVLIVLDDLKEKSQFDWLVGNRNFFGPGSRIIVTTRNKHILNILQVDAAYEPPFMNSEQSLQLFCMHAFRRTFPRNGYDDISRIVTSTAAGLPLALEVIGSFLSDKPKEVWYDTLNKLEKIPDDQVQRKLRISYDELTYEQQQIFLDIACLFIGMEKTYAFYMWGDCAYFPEKELNVLCLMSLVKMGDDNVFRMHDQLRDLGRKIVHQEDPRNPGARSRLWNGEEALDALVECRGTEKVECLRVNLFKEMSFTRKEFRKLLNLRYLEVDKAKLVGDFKHHLPELRWLCWKYCPRNFEATNFHMKNLVILDLSSSSITATWNGWSQIKMSNKLKVLKLVECDLWRTPDFSSYARLEILILRSCKKLYQIDPSIGNMKNLRVLDISWTKIRKLPHEIWMCENLEVIDAFCCYYLEGNIPNRIERLSSLRQLNFAYTKIQSLPTSICSLTRLQTLHLDSCHNLEAVPDLPSSLEILEFRCSWSRNLRVTPNNITNLVNLQELKFCGLREDVEFPKHIDKLSELQELMLGLTNISTLPKGFGALSGLKILTLDECDDLQCILGLPSSLVELSLTRCGSLERLPDLSNLKKLLKLKLERCHKLMEIQGLGELESLASLAISECSMLKMVKLLGKQKSLASLHIASCHMLKEVQGLGNLESLTNLDIVHCKEIAELDLLQHSTSLPLKTLDVSGCTNLNKIQGLERLVSLECLTLIACKSMLRLPNLSNLKMLRTLSLNRCTRLCEIDGLEALQALKEVDVSECTSLERVPHLPNKKILRTQQDTLEVMLQHITKYLDFGPPRPRPPRQ